MKVLGAGRDTFCVDLRFKPEVFTENKQLDEGRIGGHHFVHSGPHLVFSVGKDVNSGISRIVGVDGRKPIFDGSSNPYVLVTSDRKLNNKKWHTTVSGFIAGYEKGSIKEEAGTSIRAVQVYKCENTDGIYYAADPTFMDNGHFEALHFYTQTARRKVSGYNNAERTFLNVLLDFKNRNGIPRRGEFPRATWNDVDSVLVELAGKAVEYGGYDIMHKNHIEKDILPIVESYAEILKLSGLGPSLFFNPRFTDDTGQIVNQGRAVTQFRGLAGDSDIPITPSEDRSFGAISYSTFKGISYRLSPNPHNEIYSGIGIGE